MSRRPDQAEARAGPAGLLRPLITQDARAGKRKSGISAAPPVLLFLLYILVQYPLKVTFTANRYSFNTAAEQSGIWVIEVAGRLVSPAENRALSYGQYLHWTKNRPTAKCCGISLEVLPALESPAEDSVGGGEEADWEK